MKSASDTARARAEWGAIAWLAVWLYALPDLRSFAWSSALLTFAGLVLAPLLFHLAAEADCSGHAGKFLGWAQRGQLPAALLLLIANLLPAGYLAAALAMPWAVVTCLAALAGALRLRRAEKAPTWRYCRDGGLVLLAVGGAWTLADRLALHPLGFGTDIVQLTAVHFHYAGLALPVIASAVLRELPESRVGAAAGWGLLAGIPLVAFGITWAQLGGGTAGELLATAVLAPSAMIIAIMQLGLARRSGVTGAVRLCWITSGVSLLVGMALAMLYAARGEGLAPAWLDIPGMRALHGTANGLGFALFGAIGWFRAEPLRPARAPDAR